jgi:hypothetical protein
VNPEQQRLECARAHYENAALRADHYRGALDAICGGVDMVPWTQVYRNAGGGYEGLQAIARYALENAPLPQGTEQVRTKGRR